jgi:hypothetical protein
MARDFGSNQSLETKEYWRISSFQTEELGQKIRQQPKTILSSVTQA